MPAPIRITFAVSLALALSRAGAAACQQPAAGPDSMIVPAVGPRMTLNAIIQQTLAHNPSVAMAEGATRDAWAARQVAIGAYLPSLAVNSLAGWSDQSVAGGGSAATAIAPGTSRPVQRTQAVGLAALYDVFTGGRRSAQRSQADALGRAADAGLTLQRFAAIFLATQGYLDVLRAHELVRVSIDAVQQAALGLDYAQRRERAGTATRADVLSAELALSTARQRQLAAIDTLGITTSMLGRLVGADGSVDAEPPVSLEPAPLAMTDSAVIDLAVATAPAVAATQAQASANSAAVRAAKTRWIPTITAGAGYNWANTQSFPGGLRPGWVMTFATSYPIFDGFLREAAVTQAEVAADVATVTAADTRRAVRADAQRLLGNLHVAEHNIQLTRRSVGLATENLRLFRTRYRAGVATILDVLTAQTSLIQAELGFVSARFTYQSTRVALETLLGRAL